MSTSNASVDLLILGAGWTSQFLIPLLKSQQVTYAATTRNGRDSTIKFEFDPKADNVELFRDLPLAKTVLIVFPIYVSGGSERLVKGYRSTHDDAKVTFIQLGSTGIWDKGPTLKAGDTEETTHFKWIDRHSHFNASNDRGRCETELLQLPQTVVLNLAGLWGDQRSVRNFVMRVPSKEALREKGSVHLVHGEDVARAVLAIHQQPKLAWQQRWLLNDGRVYDWWDIASAFGNAGIKGRMQPAQGPFAEWVTEFMKEDEIRALPRPVEYMGRALDSSEFWQTFGISPSWGRCE